MALSFQGFRSLVEHSPDAISLIDKEGEILYGSASNSRILGYQPEEIVGRNCLDLIHPEDRAHVTGALGHVVAAPLSCFQWAARVRHKDGTYFWVESTLSNFLLEPEVQAIMLQQRDIKMRRALEAERQSSAEELARTNVRLEEFARNAAHDLREPLLTISLYASLLADEPQDTARIKQMSMILVESASRMAALIEGLLSFASTGVREPAQVVDLKYAFSQAASNLVAQIEDSSPAISLGPLPIVKSNEAQLVRLFQNLVSNAMKYRSDRPLTIKVNAHRSGKDWLVSVADNGIGIAPEDRARVFAPFVRLSNRTVAGSGLGLAVCQRIAEDLGGTIWVESNQGTGSIFFFTIAAHDLDQATLTESD